MKLKYLCPLYTIVMLLFFVSTTSNAYIKTFSVPSNVDFYGTSVYKQNVGPVTSGQVNMDEGSNINNFTVTSNTVGDGNANIQVGTYCVYPEETKHYDWSNYGSATLPVMTQGKRCALTLWTEITRHNGYFAVNLRATADTLPHLPITYTLETGLDDIKPRSEIVVSPKIVNFVANIGDYSPSKNIEVSAINVGTSRQRIKVSSNKPYVEIKSDKSEWMKIPTNSNITIDEITSDTKKNYQIRVDGRAQTARNDVAALTLTLEQV